MDHTEQDLIIVSPYFVPGKNFTRYLVGLVDKGVRVRNLTNSLAANDVSLVHAGYMRYRSALIEGGVELFEFKSDKSECLKANQDSATGPGQKTPACTASILPLTSAMYLSAHSTSMVARFP